MIQNNVKNKWLWFLIYPIMGLYLSINTFHQRASRIIVMLFSSFVGFSFLITDSYDGDAQRYRAKLTGSAAEFDIGLYLSKFYSDTQHTEIIEQLITFSVGLVTKNYQVLFGVFGLFFGYFLVKGLNEVYKYGLYTHSPIVKKLTWVYVFTIPFWFINGFPFYAACHMFIYGLFLFFHNRKVIALVVMYGSMLLHFSFILAILVVFVFQLVKKRDNLIIWFFFSSIFISFFELPFINALVIRFSPEIVENTYKGYLEVGENVAHEGGRIIGLISKVASMTLYVLSMVMYQFLMKNEKIKRITSNIFLFGFLFLGIINFLLVIPSLGRFISLGKLILIGGLIHSFINYNSLYSSGKMIKYTNIFVILYIPFVLIIMLRIMFPVVGVISLLGNFFTIMFIQKIDFVLGNVMELF
jgi:hypothetical protein